MALFLPSFGLQSKEGAFQASPLLNSYSPRLFGSPPQLTSLCDMRTDSANGNNPGTVGNFYLQNILRDAQIANFVVGRAIFTGGYTSIANTVRMMGQYGYALKHYSVYGGSNGNVGNTDPNNAALKEINLDTYNNELDLDSIDVNEVFNPTPLAEGEELTDEESMRRGRIGAYDSTLTQWLEGASALIGASITTPLLDSFKVQQPFYSFDADWLTYINNVKMMINTAVIMLGLQDACIRIGDFYYPIGMNTDENDLSDVWSNYRFITPSDGVSQVTGIDNQKGETGQYVSFMVTPVNEAESYSNQVSESQIYSSVIKQGETIGTEIAFITNSSASAVSDAVVSIAGGTISAAEKVISALGSGVGRFTAAIAGSMARSFTGDHTIYPKIFQRHESNTSGITLNIKLRASRGDPYSYLTEILVPLFHILGMVLPKMSKHSAAAYNYPPLVQCTIPGIWGTRLGMIENVEFTKNPDSNDFSINGYPLAVDVSMRVIDLTNCLVTSPMNNPALFINNHTMFDYIAQCCGVDKYRINGSVRLITKLALAAHAQNNMAYNLGSSILNDATTTINRLTRTSMM